jgi:hypothetical protein
MKDNTMRVIYLMALLFLALAAPVLAGIESPSDSFDQRIGRWVLPRLTLRGADVRAAMRYFERESKKVDPRHKGIKIFIQDEDSLNAAQKKGVTMDLSNIPFDHGLIYAISRFFGSINFEEPNIVRVRSLDPDPKVPRSAEKSLNSK